MIAQLRGAGLIAVWGSGFIGAELGARHAGPDTVLAWRCLVIAMLLLPWTLRVRLTQREWLRQAVLALLNQCLYLGGVFWAAAAGVPAGTSALIASLQPAIVLFVLTQRPPARHLVGLTLGSVGVAVTAGGDLQSGVSVAALLFPLLAMLALTAGTLLQQHWPSPPLMQTLGVQSVFTAGFFFAYALASGHLAPPATLGFWTAVAWASLAGIGSYGTYYLITRRDGADRASNLLYLTPAATALWAAAMFGQPITFATLLGLLICGTATLLLRPLPASNPVTPSGAVTPLS